MCKGHWTLLDYWRMEDKCRVIFKPRGWAEHLVDITLDNGIFGEIMDAVLKDPWSTDELIEYLNVRAVTNSKLNAS